jgi:hypothetical protein
MRMADNEKDPATVEVLMSEFAERTGLVAHREFPKRYLWTDAFAVCNLLELHRRSSDDRFLRLALGLVDQVHSVLGRFAPDDSRSGWISGLNDADGHRHPTLGGLRIGKSLPERGANEAFDERLEWERDGQYFHYLTRWMHALDCVSRVTGDVRYNHWALELAKVTYRHFVYTDSAAGTRRMVWKMSIDLSRSQVPSMGHHDPLDGLLTFMTLQASAEAFGEVSADRDLATEIGNLAGLCQGRDWVTGDCLGVGGLLVDACRLSQLVAGSLPREADRLAELLGSAETSLDLLLRNDPFAAPADYRLAFRELGLSIGLRGFDLMQATLRGRLAEGHPALRQLTALMRHAPLGRSIENFWMQPAHRQSSTWRDHLDINSVMLATSLAPRSYLDIGSGKAG